jgi:hypothetical protein
MALYNAYKPVKANRDLVWTLKAAGIPEADIASVLGIDTKTLNKHFPKELDRAEAEANGKVAGKLFATAMDGNVTAMIFWLKSRARWRETAEVAVSGHVTFVIEGPDARAQKAIESSAVDITPQTGDAKLVIEGG